MTLMLAHALEPSCSCRQWLQSFGPFFQIVADAVEPSAPVDERRDRAAPARGQRRAAADKAEDRHAVEIKRVAIGQEEIRGRTARSERIARYANWRDVACPRYAGLPVVAVARNPEHRLRLAGSRQHQVADLDLVDFLVALGRADVGAAQQAAVPAAAVVTS